MEGVLEALKSRERLLNIGYLLESPWCELGSVRWRWRRVGRGRFDRIERGVDWCRD
jgi:hypothetical protein